MRQITKAIYLLLVAFIMSSSALGSGHDVRSVFGVRLGEPFDSEEMVLPTIEQQGHPTTNIRVPMTTQLVDIFPDFRAGISLYTQNVFQVSAERAYSDYATCDLSRKKLQRYLEEQFSSKAALNKQFQFLSKDKQRWVQFACGLRISSGFWTLSFTATDEREGQEIGEWLANKQGLRTRESAPQP
jgi:hypothetical protein